MGKIMCNGKSYSGSFDKAINTSYDNSTSGLSATNVQGAVDELSTKRDNKATSFTEGWVVAKNVYGWGLVVELATNCDNISISSAQVYTTSGWVELELSAVATMTKMLGSYFVIFDYPSNVPAGDGKNYLVKITGSLS